MCGPGKWKDRITTTYLFSCWVNILAKPTMSHHIKSWPLYPPWDLLLWNERSRSQTELIQIVSKTEVYRLLKARLPQWAGRRELRCLCCFRWAYFESRELEWRPSWGCGVAQGLSKAAVWIQTVECVLGCSWQKMDFNSEIMMTASISSRPGSQKHIWEDSGSIHPLSSCTPYAQTTWIWPIIFSWVETKYLLSMCLH